jgi:hypothetical protein
MGGSYDAGILRQQQEQDQQQDAGNSRLYNPDGSGKFNDYVPPKMPASSAFPSLATGKELTVNRDSLTQVAAQMGKDLARLRATLQQLNSEGAGGALIGGWPTADGLGTNAFCAYDGISTFYENLNAAYEQVISNIRQTVSNYSDAETSTVSAVSKVGTDGPGSLAPGA